MTAASNASTRPFWPVAAAAALALVAAVYSFNHGMVESDHNENMYVAAGVLVAQGKHLYHDFAYLQMPYLAELYGAVFKITGTTHPLIVARVLNWLFWVVGAAMVGAIATRLAMDRVVGFATAMLYCFSPIMLRILSEASNYVLPATLALAQLALVLLAHQRKPGWKRSAALIAAGAAAAMSVGTKLYFVAAVAPVFLLPLLLERHISARRAYGDVLLMSCGLVLAALPIFFFMARDPLAFGFDNLRVHRLTTLNYRVTGFQGPMGLKSKWFFFRGNFLEVMPVSAFILIVGGALLTRGRIRDKFLSQALRDLAALSVVLGLTFGLTLLVAFYMSPLWTQYLAMSVPYLLLLMSASYATTEPGARPFFRAAMCIAVAFSFISCIGAGELHALRNPRVRWIPLVIESRAREIRRLMEVRGLSGKLATLQPLYATEAGLPFYLEFASGPFLFNVGELMSAKQRRATIGTSYSTVGQLFDSDPPAAILLGLYDDPREGLEAPLWEYAADHGYYPIQLKIGAGATLFLQNTLPPTTKPANSLSKVAHPLMITNDHSG